MAELSGFRRVWLNRWTKSAAQAFDDLATREATPRERLARMLQPAEFDELIAWIDERGSGQHHWSSGGYRQRMARAAVTLVACGVPLAALTTYALSQVMELHGTDLIAENVDDTATVYAMIHTTGIGPATKGLVKSVRDVYR